MHPVKLGLLGLLMLCVSACVSVPWQTLIGRSDLNFHSATAEWRDDTLHYWTGSALRTARFRGDPPEMPLASTAQRGSISVNLRAPEPGNPTEFDEISGRVALALDQITRDVWPVREVPVHVNLFRVSSEEPFGFIQRAQWQDGETWQLAFAAHTDADRITASTAHELYHLLYKAQRPQQAAAERIYEEVAAQFYGACGALNIGRPYDFSRAPYVTIAMPNPDGGGMRDYAPPFSDEDIKVLIARVDEAVANDQAPPFAIHMAFTVTALLEVADGVRVIQPDTPQAARALDMCRSMSADPRTYRDWFLEIASDGVDATVIR